MKIRRNKYTKQYEVISITIYGEVNVLRAFDSKEDAKEYVYLMTGDISVLS